MKKVLLQVKLVDRDREEKFINIRTEKGLNFTIEEPKIESADRGIISTQLFNLPLSDKVKHTDFTEEFLYKTFSVIIDKSGIIKVSDRQVNKGISTFTNSSSRILLFSNDGNVFSMPALILQNLDQKGININELWDNIDKNKILTIISVNNFKDEGNIYFFTKKGMVKKTALSEFEGEYLSTMGYKFKSDKDILIDVKYSKCNEEEVLLISKKAMGIRFSGESVNYMGKIASGVTGISLKEDDEVLYAALLNNVRNLDRMILLKSKCSEEKVNIKDIKLQNRAGRGKNLMLLAIDDNITEIK